MTAAVIAVVVLAAATAGWAAALTPLRRRYKETQK